jgi:hypothetical protein
MMSKESELRAMAARILCDLRDMPFREALDAIDEAATETCYEQTVIALGYDPLEVATNAAD